MHSGKDAAQRCFPPQPKLVNERPLPPELQVTLNSKWSVWKAVNTSAAAPLMTAWPWVGGVRGGVTDLGSQLESASVSGLLSVAAARIPVTGHRKPGVFSIVECDHPSAKLIKQRKQPRLRGRRLCAIDGLSDLV
jgi:hypothetical protein